MTIDQECSLCPPECTLCTLYSLQERMQLQHAKDNLAQRSTAQAQHTDLKRAIRRPDAVCGRCGSADMAVRSCRFLPPPPLPPPAVAGRCTTFMPPRLMLPPVECGTP